MLVLGKKRTKGDKSKIGGVITLFELFLEELRFNGVKYEVIDLNWRNYQNFIIAYFGIFGQICYGHLNRKHRHVSLHGTANEFIYIAPFLAALSKLFQKQLSLRKFAGNFDKVYGEANFLKRLAVRYALIHADIVFFETNILVEEFKKFNKNTFWFPNVRKPSKQRNSSIFTHKYVFLGQVKESKGIKIIVDAFVQLGNEYSIDVWGPIEDDTFIKEIQNIVNINYCGIIDTSSVAEMLSKYDVLLLPTFHVGEGYPGVIIEAFSVGLPVIATEWGGIPEMIASGVEGILVEPNSTSELVEAMLLINCENYARFRDNALSAFGKHNSNEVTRDVLKLMSLN